MFIRNVGISIYQTSRRHIRTSTQHDSSKPKTPKCKLHFRSIIKEFYRSGLFCDRKYLLTLSNTKFIWIGPTFKNWAPNLQKTDYISITNINRLTVRREILYTYCQNRVKNVNTSCCWKKKKCIVFKCWSWQLAEEIPGFKGLQGCCCRHYCFCLWWWQKRQMSVYVCVSRGVIKSSTQMLSDSISKLSAT
jgi:hypothetical protein